MHVSSQPLWLRSLRSLQEIFSAGFYLIYTQFVKFCFVKTFKMLLYKTRDILLFSCLVTLDLEPGTRSVRISSKSRTRWLSNIFSIRANGISKSHNFKISPKRNWKNQTRQSKCQCAICMPFRTIIYRIHKMDSSLERRNPLIYVRTRNVGLKSSIKTLIATIILA